MTSNGGGGSRPLGESEQGRNLRGAALGSPIISTLARPQEHRSQ